MLQFINDHRKSVVGLFGVVMVAFLMTGFGLNMGRMGRGQHENGIKVNDAEISPEQYYDQRRALESRMRMFMGDQLDKILPTLDLGQQAVDALISKQLLLQYARARGMRASESEVQEALLGSGLFQGGYNPEVYRSYLMQIGKSSAQFESELAEDAVVRQFTSLLSDAGKISEAEMRQVIRKSETQYTVAKVEIDPSKLTADVPDPDQETLAKFFEDNASDYETAPSVSYDYLTLDPKDFLEAVEVLPEDIEGYYVDHESKFVEPESVKVRHIQLNFDTDHDPKKMADLKEKADMVHEEAVSGKPFEDLVRQYTDDFATKDQGGDLGWIEKGKGHPEIQKAAFDAKDGGVSDVVSTEYGYEIIKVDSYKPSRSKELDEVRSEIEAIIRHDEAPGYTTAKAEELFDKWQKSGLALPEFAVQQGLTAASSKGVKKSGEDPQGMKGLTDTVLKSEDEKQQLVDVGDKSVLVAVTEYRPSEIPVLQEVKDKVIAKYKEQESSQVAKKKGEGILESLSKGAYPSFEEAVKAAGLEVTVDNGVKQAGSTPGPLSDRDVRDAVFSVRTPNTRLDRVYSVRGKYYLFEVRDITPPAAEEVEKKIKAQTIMENNQAGQMLVRSVVSALKAKAEISVSPDLPIAN